MEEIDPNRNVIGQEGEDVDVIPTGVIPSIQITPVNKITTITDLGLITNYDQLPILKLLELLRILYASFNNYQQNIYKDDLLKQSNISFNLVAFTQQIERVNKWFTKFNKTIQNSKVANNFTIDLVTIANFIVEGNDILSDFVIIDVISNKPDVKITGFGDLVPNEVKLKQLEKQIESAKAAVLNAYNIREIDVLKGQLSKVTPFDIAESRNIITWPIEFIEERTKQFDLLLDMSISIFTIKWVISTIESLQIAPTADMINRYLNALVKSALQTKSRVNRSITHAVFQLTYTEYQIILFEYIKSMLTMDNTNTPRINFLYRLVISHSCEDSLKLIIDYLPAGQILANRQSDGSSYDKVQDFYGSRINRDYNSFIIGIYATMKDQIDLMKHSALQYTEFPVYGLILNPLNEYVNLFMVHSYQVAPIMNDPQMKSQYRKLSENFEIKLATTEFGLFLREYEHEQANILNAISGLKMQPQNIFIIRENAYYKLDYFREQLKMVEMVSVGHVVDVYPDDDVNKHSYIDFDIGIDLEDDNIATPFTYELYANKKLIKTENINDRLYKKLLTLPGDRDGDYFAKISYVKGGKLHSIQSPTITIKVINTCLRCGIHYRESKNNDTACRWTYNEQQQKSLEKVDELHDISDYTYDFLVKYLKEYNLFRSELNLILIKTQISSLYNVDAYKIAPYNLILNDIKKMERIASDFDHLRHLVSNLKTKFNTFLESTFKKSIKSQSTFDTTLHETSTYYKDIISLYEERYSDVYSNATPQAFLFNVISYDDMVKSINDLDGGINQIYNKMILINRQILNHKYSEGDIEDVCLRLYRGLRINKPTMDIFTDFDSYISSNVTYHENKKASDNLARNNFAYKYVGRHSNKQRRPDTYKVKFSLYLSNMDGNHVFITSREFEPYDDISRQFKYITFEDFKKKFVRDFNNLDPPNINKNDNMYLKFEPVMGSMLEGHVGRETTQSIISRLKDQFSKSLKDYKDHLHAVTIDRENTNRTIMNITQGAKMFNEDYSDAFFLAHKINQFLLYAPIDNLV